MNTIVAILRAAHCKSVHHYFAIDALCEVISSEGQQLVRLLLAHFNEYLKGAKDPDNSFKDFENHVVHVADGYWGGAAKAANRWFVKSCQLLQNQKWSEAAYAIGVLSHYFTDPIMPLHTGQSARETAIHRPLEWSVCCAYEEIYSLACSSDDVSSFELPQGDAWLSDAIHLGARLAHQYYEELLDDYDMTESRRFPAKALGSRSKRILAQLFTWAITGWADTLERIASLADQDIPMMSLTVPTILATSQVPAKRIAKKLETSQQRAEVEAILEEYLQTGKVVRNLPVEQKLVRKTRLEQPLLKPSQNDVLRAEQIAAPKSIKKQPVVQPASKSFISQTDESTKFSENEPPKTPEAKTSVIGRPTPETSVASGSKRVQIDPSQSRPRKNLHLDSPIIDAPAIGPKTASRFATIGVHTIGDFLDCDHVVLASSLNAKWITPKVVSQWKAQSRLAIDIERLSAAGAGLLVLSGIESANDVAAYDAQELHRLILETCETSEAKRLLRDKPPPPLATVERWIESATQVASLQSTRHQQGL